jgi:carbonic anhydrase
MGGKKKKGGEIMNHTCQTIVFRCMDFRITAPAFAELLAQEKIGQPGEYDLISLAGSAKAILDGGKDLLLEQIKIAVKLHGVKKVVLIMHDQCGAYGITDPKAEETKQIHDLQIIGQIVSQECPQIRAVGKYILKGTATGNFSLQRVGK